MCTDKRVQSLQVVFSECIWQIHKVLWWATRHRAPYLIQAPNRTLCELCRTIRNERASTHLQTHVVNSEPAATQCPNRREPTEIISRNVPRPSCESRQAPRACPWTGKNNGVGLLPSKWNT